MHLQAFRSPAHDLSWAEKKSSKFNSAKFIGTQKEGQFLSVKNESNCTQKKESNSKYRQLMEKTVDTLLENIGVDAGFFRIFQILWFIKN